MIHSKALLVFFSLQFARLFNSLVYRDSEFALLQDINSKLDYQRLKQYSFTAAATVQSRSTNEIGCCGFKRIHDSLDSKTDYESINC